VTLPPDKLLISGIDCVAAIGVTPEERTMKQRLSVDIEVTTDIRRAASSDALSDALDYSTIVPVVVQLAASRDFHLIETIAEQIARLVLADFGGETVRVVVRKTPVLSSPVHHVSVEITRAASEAPSGAK
jgi:dihydroneopterin aldolase